MLSEPAMLWAHVAKLERLATWIAMVRPLQLETWRRWVSSQFSVWIRFRFAKKSVIAIIKLYYVEPGRILQDLALLIFDIISRLIQKLLVILCETNREGSDVCVFFVALWGQGDWASLRPQNWQPHCKPEHVLIAWRIFICNGKSVEFHPTAEDPWLAHRLPRKNLLRLFPHGYYMIFDPFVCDLAHIHVNLP